MILDVLEAEKMTKTKVTLAQLEQMGHHSEGYGGNVGFSFIKSSVVENNESVPKIILRIAKHPSVIELTLNPSQEANIEIREVFEQMKEPFKTEAKLKKKYAEKALEADLYSTSEDGANAHRSFGIRFEDKEAWAKVEKHYEYLDELEEIHDELEEIHDECFDFEKEQSKTIPMEFHKIAFELKKQVAAKAKSLNWEERRLLQEALKFQGLEVGDFYEKNWNSSSADCRHLMCVHDEVADELEKLK